MVAKGLLERVERGKYNVKTLGDYAKTKTDVNAGYDIPSKAGMPYALTRVDGVFVWTRGGYNASRFFGFYPIHMKVLAKEVSRWYRYFSRIGKTAVRFDRKPDRTLFGVFYLLYPEPRIRAELVEGLKVEPLTETIKFCKDNRYTFEPALEMLTRKSTSPM